MTPLRYEKGRLEEKLISAKVTLDNMVRYKKKYEEYSEEDKDIAFAAIEREFIAYCEFIISLSEHFVAKSKLYRNGMSAVEYLDSLSSIEPFQNLDIDFLKYCVKCRNRMVHDYFKNNLQDEIYDICFNNFDKLAEFYNLCFSLI